MHAWTTLLTYHYSSTTPKVVIMCTPLMHERDDSDIINFVWLLRLLRFLRGIVFMKVMVESSFNGVFNLGNVTTMYMINVSYTALSLVNIMTSMWLGVASRAGDGEVTWITRAGIEGKGMFVQYVYAAFFTLTTVRLGGCGGG